jgi:hypothetical protein
MNASYLIQRHKKPGRNTGPQARKNEASPPLLLPERELERPSSPKERIINQPPLDETRKERPKRP